MKQICTHGYSLNREHGEHARVQQTGKRIIYMCCLNQAIGLSTSGVAQVNLMSKPLFLRKFFVRKNKQRQDKSVT